VILPVSTGEATSGVLGAVLAPQYKRMPWFSLAGHQVPTKAALSLPLLIWTGREEI